MWIVGTARSILSAAHPRSMPNESKQQQPTPLLSTVPYLPEKHLRRESHASAVVCDGLEDSEKVWDKANRAGGEEQRSKEDDVQLRDAGVSGMRGKVQHAKSKANAGRLQEEALRIERQHRCEMA